MTSSLPLLASAALVAGLVGGPAARPVTDAASPGTGRAGPAAAHRAHPADATGAPGVTGAPGAAGPVAPAAADVADVTDVVEHVAADDAPGRRRVLDYWTPQRMAAAVPLGVLGKVTGLLGGRRAATDDDRPAAPAAGRPGALTVKDLPAAPAVKDLSAAPAVKGLSAAPAAGGDRRAVSAHGRPAAATERLAAPAARTRRAAPVTGARWVTGGSVAQTVGRVFLTVGGVDYVCSAGSVRSANRDLVVTAGHCVKDGAGAWADNWVFVPGYDRGRQPYGQFTARRMFVAGPWARGADDSYDVGMVALNTRNGRHLGDVVGAQEIAFGTPRGRPAHGFGFPADAPYDGEHLVYCAGPVHDDPHEQTADQGMRCDMTAGSSGGPWLTGFDAVTGRGTITSVSSFKYSDDHGTMYGPYFGSTVRDLHTVAERS
ncbi:trypsin-like serine peptidase [Streptosporangium sandarakinum]|uniref:trypsin-like serine peptidase n=1 Tax=Streptosporangium sandarakinum TaxID=1260955 RepID=UPI00343642F9